MDGGVEKSVRNFSLTVSYLSFFFRVRCSLFNAFLLYRLLWLLSSGKTHWISSVSSKNKWIMLILSLTSLCLGQLGLMGRREADLYHTRERLKRLLSRWETCKGLAAQHRTLVRDNHLLHMMGDFSVQLPKEEKGFWVKAMDLTIRETNLLANPQVFQMASDNDIPSIFLSLFTEYKVIY